MFLAKFFKSKNQTPFNNVKPFYKDSKGLYWYEYNDAMGMAPMRYVKLQKFLSIWNMNLTDTQLDELLELANTTIEDGLVKKSNGKHINMLKIAGILNEIKSRREYIRPFELLADLLAINFLREDEDYYMFDNKIHIEKKEYILEHAKKKEVFFLDMKFYRDVTKSSLDSSESLQIYLEHSELQPKIHETALKFLAGLK